MSGYILLRCEVPPEHVIAAHVHHGRGWWQEIVADAGDLEIERIRWSHDMLDWPKLGTRSGGAGPHR